MLLSDSSAPRDPLPMDTVFIEDLRIDAVIGIYEWERKIRQTLSFDIEMAFDNTVPAASDDIAHGLRMTVRGAIHIDGPAGN